MVLFSFLWRSAFFILALVLLVLMAIEFAHGATFASIKSGGIAVFCLICLHIDRSQR